MLLYFVIGKAGARPTKKDTGPPRIAYDPKSPLSRPSCVAHDMVCWAFYYVIIISSTLERLYGSEISVEQFP